MPTFTKRKHVSSIINRSKKNNNKKRIQYGANLNLTDPDNKIKYISLQIYQGYSSDFRKEVEEGSKKLSKLIEKEIRRQMKDNRKAIKAIIKQSIFSSTTGNTQYFKNINNYDQSEKTLEAAVSTKMINEIIDKTFEKVNKSMAPK